MIPVQFNLEETQLQFLQQFDRYGFQDESEVVRIALTRLQELLQIQQLEESADLYADIYAEDTELQDWTDLAASEPML